MRDDDHMRMIQVDGGEVYINEDRTEVITTYGETITLHDKEIVTVQLDDKTVAVGWVVQRAESAVAVAVELNSDPDKARVVAVYPEQVTPFGGKGVN